MPRTVQLSDDAYATLAALKRPGESFSEVVKRLASERRDPLRLLQLRGTLEGFDKVRGKMREADRRRAREFLGGG